MRLTRRQQYQRVYRCGTRVAGPSLVLFGMRNDGEEGRLGITATRKVGGAVVRNRAKRLMREAFRIQAARFAGWDLVVNVKTTTAGRSAQELSTELARAFEKLFRRSDAAERRR